MSHVSVKCVFCHEANNEKIINFTQKTLEKCTTILEYRRVKAVRKKPNRAYTTVEISNETSLSHGYHAHCYKLFTAIKVPSDFQTHDAIISETTEVLEVLAEKYSESQVLEVLEVLDEESYELSVPDTSSTTQAAGTAIVE